MISVEVLMSKKIIQISSWIFISFSRICLYHADFLLQSSQGFAYYINLLSQRLGSQQVTSLNEFTIKIF